MNEMQSQPSPSTQNFRRRRRAGERVRILGGEIDLVRPEELFHGVALCVAENRKALILNHNLHSLAIIRKNLKMKELYRHADWIQVDSRPLVYWAKYIGLPANFFHRSTYLDWRNNFWGTASAKGWKVFFVGGVPEIQAPAREAIVRQWPKIRLETHPGYFDHAPGSDDNRALVDRINQYQPDILLVGMGMPWQEQWILTNYDALPPCVIFTVGGAFDYEAGAQVACPRWIGRLGLEWMFRLALNPKRLFWRYCIEPWELLDAALVDIQRLNEASASNQRSAITLSAGHRAV